jgi:hypothetical protein
LAGENRVHRLHGGEPLAELGDADRHDGDAEHAAERAARVGVQGSQFVDGAGEFVAVVVAGTKHDLRVDLDLVVGQFAQLGQDGFRPFATQHLAAHVGIGGVNAHVERRQALLQNTRPLLLGDVGERDVVAVQETQPVVVVLDVQAGAANPSGCWYKKQKTHLFLQMWMRSNRSSANVRPRSSS